eukprot:CAMPEP_0170496556 /NCGR_PEP_ID=MMETSP0208-20121228/22081_1 /TAXON_ID=197538 /ORGANISM="Strombidium inclinatum, Strain S3" /LENGTH=246 /DNA_ID=CAMNT_0010773141 /DNA_START=1486 /DNA_END=2229 /DNA_ORIENTATION=-
MTHFHLEASSTSPWAQWGTASVYASTVPRARWALRTLGLRGAFVATSAAAEQPLGPSIILRVRRLEHLPYSVRPRQGVDHLQELDKGPLFERAAAHQDLYYDFDSHLDLSKGGIVYPFTGIRGDAKELWQRIKNGNEKHIELIRADSAEHQRPYLRDADIVIVACGYHSVQVPIFDNNGYEINLATHHNRADRSTQIQKQRIAQMTQGNSMQNVAQTMINGPPGISDLYPPAVILRAARKSSEEAK